MTACQGVQPAPAPGPGLAAAAFEALSPPCLVLDGQGCVLLANNAAEQFFCKSARRLAGMPLATLFGADSPLGSIHSAHHRTGYDVIEHAIRLRRGDGTWIAAAISLATLQGGEASVLTLHDWTQARALRRRLRFRAGARTLSGLSRVLTRRVRNPLAAIRGAAQLLESSVRGPDRELATLIREEGDRITHLLDRIAGTDEPLPPRRPVNLHRVAEQARETIVQQAQAKGITLAEDYDPSLPPAWGDRERLQVALIELLRNAVRAAHGRVVIGTAYRHGMRSRAANAHTDLPLEISVRDDGPGIPSPVLAHLFAPFASLREVLTDDETTQDVSYGIGLARCAQIIEDHGGLIEITTGDDAPQGRGTRIALLLPAYNADHH